MKLLASPITLFGGDNLLNGMTIKEFRKHTEEYVFQYWNVKSTKEIAEELGITTATVNNKIRKLRRLGLIVQPGYIPRRKHSYAPIYEKLLREYSEKTAREIANDLDVPIKCVYVAASKLIKQGELQSKKEDWETKDNLLEVV